jgi:hypothetical protein
MSTAKWYPNKCLPLCDVKVGSQLLIQQYISRLGMPGITTNGSYEASSRQHSLIFTSHLIFGPLKTDTSSLLFARALLRTREQRKRPYLLSRKSLAMIQFLILLPILQDYGIQESLKSQKNLMHSIESALTVSIFLGPLVETSMKTIT